MRRPPIPALLLALALALVAAGCGGGGDGGPEGVAPEAWAADVCGSLATWQQTLQDKAQSLTGDVLQAGPAAAKDKIGEFLDEVIADTDSLLESFDAAGVPAVEQGGQLRDDFRGGLQEMRAAFEEARGKVDDVPTDDPQAFQQQLTEIGSSLQTEGQRIGETMEGLDEKYDAPDLDRAFDENEQCAQFQQ